VKTFRCLILACSLLAACAQNPSTIGKPFASRVLTGPVFTTGIEGPATDRQGNLYLVNLGRDGTIGRIPSDTSVPELFVNLPSGSIGNGIVFDRDGMMYIADYTGHNVLKIAPGTAAVAVHAHNPSMNQPNDLAITRNGTLFASDPNWKLVNGKLWRIDRDGSTHLLAEDMGTTNGVEVSPDERALYVNESVQRIIWKFDLDAKGNISNKRKLIEFPDGGLDGMRCDREGNIYIARYGKGNVTVVSSEGKLIREIALHGEKPTNVAFTPDYKRMFVTIQDKKWVEVFDVTE
jgi:sugar lactone lactonase YvrE